MHPLFISTFFIIFFQNKIEMPSDPCTHCYVCVCTYIYVIHTYIHTYILYYIVLTDRARRVVRHRSTRGKTCMFFLLAPLKRFVQQSLMESANKIKIGKTKYKICPFSGGGGVCVCVCVCVCVRARARVCQRTRCLGLSLGLNEEKNNCRKKIHLR